MSLGKQVRLSRIFAHPSGNLCSIAVDHFTIYNIGLPQGLRQIEKTLDAVMAGEPDAVTMHKGVARALWHKYAGKKPLIIQSSGVRPDDSSHVNFATVEEALMMGADATAVVAYVHGATESYYLANVAEYVREGDRHAMPIICHVYPRDKDNNIVYNPEDIAWAVRCIVEIGADVVKVPYCGDPVAHAQIVADCPVPVVAAGGPKTATMRDALNVLREACDAGVRGGTVGRNVWGSDDVTGAVRAYKAVIHDGKSADEALA
ncbi:MAG: aldolase [Anaerolineae bacterium]|nr:aldolase [Anaerolineae bacterium]